MGLQQTEDIQRLCRIILRKEWVTQEKLFHFYHQYLILKLKAFQCSYRIHQSKGRLSLLDQDSRELNGVEIPRNRAYHGQWLPFATDNLALFDEQGQFLGLQERQQPQLSPAPWGGVAWIGSRAYHMDHLLQQTIPLEDCHQGPLDIYLPSQAAEGFFVCDRGAGKVFCLDLPLTHLTAQLTIRPPGDKKALNLAYASQSKQAYITAQGGGTLHVVHLPSRKHEQRALNLGPLGNILVDERSHQLFVIAVNGEQPLLQSLNLTDLTLKQSYPISGHLFSQLDDPCDLMALSEDGRYIYVMSYTDQPALMTPMISVLDIHHGQWQQTHTLKKEDKPVGIGFLKPGLAPKLVPDFDTLLVQKGLLSAEQVREALDTVDKLKQDAAKKPVAPDVLAKTAEMQKSFSETELQAVATVSRQVMTDLLQDPVFEWEGRAHMSPAEKQALIEEMAALQPVKEVAQTNGVFVLNWIKGLMG